MVRDLVDVSVNLMREEARERVRGKAEEAAEERLLDLLLPAPRGYEARVEDGTQSNPPEGEAPKTRETFRRMLREGKLDDRKVEIEVSSKPPTSFVQNFSAEGVQDMVFQLQDMIGGMKGGPKKRRRVSVSEAREILQAEEAEKLLDMDQVHREALEVASHSGIVFIDEIDKVAGTSGGGKGGPDVSREGVQRDLLPIVEGSSVSTKYGRIRTDHILFIAAGAFHTSKVSDLIPELQGRFPIRVELSDLQEEEFVRILREPRNSLVKQYTALLEVEGVRLELSVEAVHEIARVAAEVNRARENIGARRLHTVMETLLEDISFDAPELGSRTIELDADTVRSKLQPILESEDLSRFVL